MTSRSILVWLLLAIMAPSANGGIDPDSDHVAVYFDTNADNYATFVALNTPFYAYVILTNPSMSNITSVAFQYRIETASGFEPLIFRLNEIRVPGDVTCVSGCQETDPFEGYHILDFGPGLPAAPAVVVMQWEFILLGNFPVLFFLGPIDLVSFEGVSPSYVSGENTVELGTLYGNFYTATGYVNQWPPISVEKNSFGSVKALYR